MFTLTLFFLLALILLLLKLMAWAIGEGDTYYNCLLSISKFFFTVNVVVGLFYLYSLAPIEWVDLPLRDFFLIPLTLSI